MGNYKFKFSDMIPNAWFYKLKNMNKVKNHHKTTKNYQLSSPIHPHLSKIANQPQLSHQRKSYHFKRDLTDNFLPKSPIKNKKIPVEPSRKSSRRSTKKNRPKNRLVSSSITAGCSCRATIESVRTKPPPEYSTQEEYLISHSPDQNSSSEFDSVFNEYGSDRDRDRDRAVTPDVFDEMLSFSTKCKCNSQNDIVIELDKNINPEFRVSVPQLTPIKTNKQHPINVQKMSTKSLSVSSQSYEKLNLSKSVRVVKEDLLLRTVEYTTLKGNKTGEMEAHISTRTTTKTRSFVGNSSSPGLKLRTNSPRIADRRIQGGRKSSLGSRRCNVSESFAVVKSSKNPGRDFRESMVEMIVENNIKKSKDLEELLACYLSLNSDEYHDLIINVFKQIWFDFVRVRIK